MSIIQTRRSLSVRGTTYAHLRRLTPETQSISDFVEDAIARHCAALGLPVPPPRTNFGGAIRRFTTSPAVRRQAPRTEQPARSPRAKDVSSPKPAAAGVPRASSSPAPSPPPPAKDSCSRAGPAPCARSHCKRRTTRPSGLCRYHESNPDRWSPPDEEDIELIESGERPKRGVVLVALHRQAKAPPPIPEGRDGVATRQPERVRMVPRMPGGTVLL